MKKSLFSITSSVLLLVAGCQTPLFQEKPEENSQEVKNEIVKKVQLPFEISINGKKALPYSETIAKIAKPLPNNGEVVCNIENSDMIQLDFFPANENGVVIGGKKPKLIIIREGNKTTLDQTISHKKLSKGFYLMNVTAGDKQARVIIQIN